MKPAIAINQQCADRVATRIGGPILVLLVLGATAPHAAAANSPSIDVLGSYFPAWLLCIVVGIVLTIFARLLFIGWKLDAHLFPAPIVYPCLTAVFAMTTWLIFFRN
jgi:YtcA family